MTFGKCGRVWRVRAKQVGECRQVWRVLAKPLDECWFKQDRSFYAQITYFICIKRSSLHSLNLPNSPNLLNLCKTRQTRLSRVWRVLAKWFGECQPVWRVRPIFQKDHIGKFSNSPKMANFRPVLEFDKFAAKWPLLNFFSKMSFKLFIF